MKKHAVLITRMYLEKCVTNKTPNDKKLPVSLIDQEKKLNFAIVEYENNDMRVAIPHFLELAKHNCEEAFLYLSLIYRDGDGAEKDDLKSVRYKRKYINTVEAKAALGVRAYQLKLAYILQFGDGVMIDNVRAFSLFLELAKGGCGEAQFHLSRIFAHGECGQSKDALLESKWLNEAVKSEWPLAMYYSALLLERTSNAPESISQVAEMMNRSSELGCWQAKEYLLSMRDE